MWLHPGVGSEGDDGVGGLRTVLKKTIEFLRASAGRLWWSPAARNHPGRSVPGMAEPQANGVVAQGD
jgi:hypothetical protein